MANVTMNISKKKKKSEKKVLKKIAIGIFISFISVLIILGIFEVTLRTTHLFNARISYGEPDRLLGYRFVANTKYWAGKENDHPITGRINSFGWRDKGWLIEKPSNTFRIAVLGDSFVEAFQVELEKTFLKLTERKIKQICGLNVQLMNFGRSGYTQSEQFLVLEREVLGFSPDMVILFFYPINDIKDISKETASDKIRPFFRIVEDGNLVLDTSFSNSREYKLKCLINWIKRHSALVSLLTGRYNSFKLKRHSASLESPITNGKRKDTKKITGYLSLCTKNPDKEYQSNYRLNKQLISAMVNICDKRKIKFMLVTVDTGLYVPRLRKKYSTIDESLDPFFFEDNLRAFSESLDVYYLGLQSVFAEHYKENEVLLHWGTWDSVGHWNYEGHELVADVLSDKILSVMSQGIIRFLF